MQRDFYKSNTGRKTGTSGLILKFKSLPILIGLLLLFQACSSVQTAKPDVIIPSYQKPTSSPTYESIFFYGLGEAAFIENDFLLAREYFNLADSFDPTNVHIKERLIETLFLLGRTDRKYIEEIFTLDFVESGFISPEILRYTAQALFSTERNEEGVALLKRLIEIEPEAENYFDLFFYQAMYLGEAEFIYLEKALAKSWTKPNMASRIAMLYDYYNPIRAKEILEKVYANEKDNQSLHQLLEFYIKHKDWNSLADYVKAGFEEGRDIDEKHLKFYLEIMLQREEYQEIIKYYSLAVDVNALSMMFIAASYEMNLELAEEIGEKVLALAEDRREMVSSVLGELYLSQKKYYPAARHLSKLFYNIGFVDEVAEMMLRFEDEEYTIDVEEFTKALLEYETEQEIVSLILSKYYNLRGEKDISAFHLMRALEAGYLLEEEDIDNDDLWKAIAVLFLDYGNIENARLALARVSSEDFHTGYFMGRYLYYQEGQDKLAEEVLLEHIEALDKPLADSFLLLAGIYERNKEHEKELELLDSALNFYPDDANILNWIGYSLVLHTDRFEEAETYLLKAISIEPDSYFIQDSVGWLYYKMNDYDKAKIYFDKIIEIGVTDSVIAYHIGSLYKKTADYPEAEKYFNLAVELDNDKDSVENSLKNLEELKNK